MYLYEPKPAIMIPDYNDTRSVEAVKTSVYSDFETNPTNFTRVTKSDLFITCSDSANMGSTCSVLMPVLILQILEMIVRVEV